MPQKHFFAYFLVVLSSFFYGTNPALSKLMAAAGGNTHGFLLVRFVLTVCLLLGVCISFKKPIRLSPKNALKIMGLGSMIYGVSFFYISAVQFIPAGLATVLLFTYPLWISFFEALLNKKKPAPLKLALMILAFCGLVLLSFKSLSGPMHLKGFAFALIAALGLAFNALWGYKITQKFSSFTVSFWMMVGCLIISLLTLTYQTPLFPETQSGFLMMGAAAVFFCFGLLTFFVALPQLGAAEASFFNNLEPLVSLGLAYVFLHESLSVLEMLGAGVILVSVTLMSIVAQKKRPT